MITIQNYVRAESLEQAWQLNQKRSARVLGGMLWLKIGKNTVGTAIDLSGLGLDAIEEDEGQFAIGAMVTLRQLELHPGFAAYTGGMAARALAPIVGVQFRNMATVGGSIWGRFGFSDVLTLFLAMDTEVELYRGGRVPLAQFAAMGYDNDILVRLIVRKTPLRLAYQAMRIQRTDLPVLTCAAAQTEAGVRAVIGARPGKAVVVPDAAGLLAGGITPERAAAFADDVASRTPMGGNARGSAAYRTHLCRVLTRRAVLELEGGAQ